jgi:hypothetical protein
VTKTLAVGAVLGPVQTEAAQGGEVALDPIDERGVGLHVGQFDGVAAAQSPTRESFDVDRCGLKLSITMAMRTTLAQGAQIPADHQELGAVLGDF